MAMNQWGCFVFIVNLIGLIHSSHSYRILIDALAEECFFDRVETGTKIGITFEVIEGGFLDIDLSVKDPDGVELFSKQRESSGRISFSVTKPGVYWYCFSNKMSTVTPKEMVFQIEVGEPSQPITDFSNYSSQEIKEIQPEKVEQMIRELRSAISGIKHEQEYMEVRDKVHRRINESTNFRVTVWVVFEAVLVLGVTLSQVIYIKRFFEVRRMV